MENRQLKDHFEHVKSSPLFRTYYSDVLDVAEAPILDKIALAKILETNFDIKSEKSGVYLVRSGGSTNKPLVFPVDIKENLYQRELVAKGLISDGIFSGESVVLNLFSYKEMYRTAGIMDDVLERCNSTSLALGSSTTEETVCASIDQFSPTTIMGTPSRLSRFAKHLDAQNSKVEIPDLLFAGEFLRPSQQKEFERLFGTKNVYSMYGSAETGIWGWCYDSTNPSLFRILDEIIVEVDSPNEDGFGTILVTNLIRKRFPMFRYNMGDVGKVVFKDDKRFLLLKSRGEKSFQLNANKHNVGDFNEIFENDEFFQIQLSSNTALQSKIEFLVVSRKEQDSSDLEKKIEEVKSIIDFDPEIIDVEVRIVDTKDLFTNSTTSKTPQLVDFRS